MVNSRVKCVGKRLIVPLVLTVFGLFAGGAFGQAEEASASAAVLVPVTFSFTYHDFPLKLQLREVKPAHRYSIGKTGNLELTKIERSKVFAKVISDTVMVKPGSAKSFVLTIENKSDTDLYFMAVPHTAHPAEASKGHRFECLCNHQVYTVKKNSIWYRVVRMELEDAYVSSGLRLDHSIVGVKEGQARGAFKSRLME